jgi:hypothetical protein
VRLLELYLAGFLLATAVLVLVAVGLRKSHGMRPVSMVALALSAGLAWPLLAVAVVQVACFVTLAKGFRTIGVRNGRVLPAADEPLLDGADDQTVPMMIVELGDDAGDQLTSDSLRSRKALAGSEPLQPSAI